MTSAAGGVQELLPVVMFDILMSGDTDAEGDLSASARTLWSVAHAKGSAAHSRNCAERKMPISVSLSLPQSSEVVVEMPDDATALTVKEHIYEKWGFPVGELKVITVQGCRLLKNDDLLSSDVRFRKLKVTSNPVGGCVTKAFHVSQRC